MASWNDGVSKELYEYFESINNFGDLAIQSVQEQIDLEVEKLFQQLQETTPRGKTLGLLNSLRKSKITVRYNWYGYTIEFEGEDRKGVP